MTEDEMRAGIARLLQNLDRGKLSLVMSFIIGLIS